MTETIPTERLEHANPRHEETIGGQTSGTTLSPPRPSLRRLAFSRVEVAKILGVSPVTVDRLTKRGLLRPSRAIRRPLYAEAELLRFLSETSARTGGK